MDSIILAMLFGRGIMAVPAASIMPTNNATATTPVVTNTEPVVSAQATAPIMTTSSLATQTLTTGVVSAILNTSIPSTATDAVSALATSADSVSFRGFHSPSPVTSAGASGMTPAPATVTVTSYFVPAPPSMFAHAPWATHMTRPGFVPAGPQAEETSVEEACRDMWILDDAEGWVPRWACPEKPDLSGTSTDLVSEDATSVQTTPAVPTSTPTEGVVSIQTAPAVSTSTPSEGIVSIQTAPAVPIASLAPAGAANSTTGSMRKDPAIITGLLPLAAPSATPKAGTAAEDLVQSVESSE